MVQFYSAPVACFLSALDTRLAANAALDRSYTGDQLSRSLERVEKTIEELEAQNQAGEDAALSRLPDQLANREALRQRVQ